MGYAATTLATLRARLQDRYKAVPFWSNTEANDAINETLRWYNLYTGYWRGAASVVTVADQVFYSVSSSLTSATRMTRAGYPLLRKSIAEMYLLRKNWRTQTTASGGSVPTTVKEWIPVGLRTVAIWPAHHAGGLTLTLEAVKITPILSADGDFLDLGNEEIDPLLDEALYTLGFKRPSELPGLAERHTNFLSACLAKNEQLRASSYFRAQLGLNQQERIYPIRSKSTDDGAAAGGVGG